ncbi:peptidoglycan-binding domain-containing protein [Cellulomonas alba]|uniref:Peptidoglycan-binding domain-containing protein n=1 Tax=Cellulomonas alba TaxID=3053467 RepID=A0ABT7SGH7_9CELL|nr:peptidoglycan-binding domain-containing protein [Cellulomonas alba]MDM7855298.1 peptidoglycan-binding domain-containing protein [Cellulomonas alba]
MTDQNDPTTVPAPTVPPADGPGIDELGIDAPGTGDPGIVPPDLDEPAPDPTADTDDDFMLASVLAEPDEAEAPPGGDEQEDQDADDDVVAPDLPTFLPFPGRDEIPGPGFPGVGAPGDEGFPGDGFPGDGFPGDEGAFPPPPMPADPGQPHHHDSPPRTMMIAAMLALKKGFAGLCLGYTRRVFGCPAKFGTAFKAWKGAELKVTRKSHPPAGVPAFFTPSKNGFGHIAPSLGNGIVRSTNSGTGKISNVPVDTITSVWHQPYLGYSLDLNGKLIAPLLTADLDPGDEGDAVVFLQGRLSWAGHKLALDGVFGKETTKAVKAFQKEHGLPQVGRMGPLTRAKINAVH